MHYISTRGRAPAASFEETLLAGLAPDGGLYMPSEWPAAPAAEGEETFAEAAARILHPYMADWIARDDLAAMAAGAYASFETPAVAPLTPLGEGRFLLELFHGPTLAFKDVAMQLLGAMVERALANKNRRLTIIGATSGDTGAAAIEAFRGRENIDIVILHPKGRVSDVQRLMMTTARDANVHNLAIESDFDACQRIVKTLFADRPFAERVGLSGVNSINWARLAIQTVYYFTALADLERLTGAPSASFAVPTGNFGDAFAGYVARKMGAPVEKLCVAVNRNDILYRALTTGVYAPATTAPTMSPSMDIQVASNFERLLFEASGRDGAKTAALFAALDSDGRFEAPASWRSRMDEVFVAARADEDETAATMRRVREAFGVTIDPHTAVGVAAAEKLKGVLTDPVIVLSTAHAAKFPDAVEQATGTRPALPARAAHINEGAERCETAPADPAAVRDYLLSIAAER